MVAGHSWGGSVAVFAAAALPERTAALVLDDVRPGCRHHVFADLGPRAGELVAEWLRGQGLP